MNVSEAALLCAYVQALAPAQTFAEETAVAWATVLGDVRLVDARTAVTRLVRRDGVEFVAPGQIRQEVVRIRRERLAGVDDVPVPADPDDVQAWLAARRRVIAWIGDGGAAPPPLPVTASPGRLRALTAGVFRGPPDEDPVNGRARCTAGPKETEEDHDE